MLARRRLLLVLLTGAALAGCGGGEQASTYASEVAAVQRAVRAEAATVSPQLEQAKTRREVAAGLAELGDVVRDNAASLGRITPPERVAPQHAAYADLMSGFADDLDRLAVRVRSADAGSLPSIRRDVQTTTARVSDRERRLLGQINARLAS